jgi:hypothetical protein
MQYFIFFHDLRVNTLRDTDAACVANLLALCVNTRKEIRRWIKEWYIRRPQYTEKQLMTDSRLSEPNDNNNFSLWLIGKSFDETRDCYPYSR